MAVLALTCVKRRIEKEEIEADIKDLNKTNVYITSLVNKILSAKNDGLFGNIFSTGEAMQVSQSVNQETGKGFTEKSNIFILPYWPPKDLLSILFPILTLIDQVCPL